MELKGVERREGDAVGRREARFCETSEGWIGGKLSWVEPSTSTISVWEDGRYQILGVLL